MVTQQSHNSQSAPASTACLVFCITLALAVSVGAQDTGGNDVRFELPENPRTPVFELLYEGGSNTTGRPVRAMAVFADRTVLVPAANSVARDTRRRLSEDDMTSLLSDLLVSQQLLDCHTEDIQQSVERAGRASGRDWRFPNATTTVIRVRLADRTHEVRCPAAELLAERFSDVEQLCNVCGAQQRLQNVMALTQIGGRSEAERLCEIVNSELGIGDDDRARVRERDLQYVRESRDGLRYVQFMRRGDDETGTSPALISLFESPDGPARVSLTPLPRRLQ